MRTGDAEQICPRRPLSEETAHVLGSVHFLPVKITEFFPKYIIHFNIYILILIICSYVNLLALGIIYCIISPGLFKSLFSKLILLLPNLGIYYLIIIFKIVRWKWKNEQAGLTKKFTLSLFWYNILHAFWGWFAKNAYQIIFILFLRLWKVEPICSFVHHCLQAAMWLYLFY